MSLGLTEVEVEAAVEEDAAISNFENRQRDGRDVRDGYEYESDSKGAYELGVSQCPEKL